MTARLELVPLTWREADWFVARWHRHHEPSRGHKFSLGAAFAGEVVAVATVGRPVARENQDGVTAEVTRLATDEVPRLITDRRGREHPLCAASFLYGACARAACALGYHRLGTYTLATERGVSLTAAGWRVLWQVRGRSWNCPGRPRVDRHPTFDKLFWGVGAWEERLRPRHGGRLNASNEGGGHGGAGQGE